MRALRFHDFGVENLRIEELPAPQPDQKEVLVRVHASSITQGDIKNVQGSIRDLTTLPRVPGRDFAGVIERGPEDCIGQEVWGTGGDLGSVRDGTHAEYVIVPAEAVVPKPANVSLEQAGSLGSALVTAWVGLFDRAGLKKGETLLVVGANGSVGHAAVQLGSWAGARVLGITRDGENRSGANVVLSSSASSFREDLQKAVGSGVHVVFDTAGGDMFELLLNALRPSGRMISITVSGGPRAQFDLLRFYRNDLRLFGLNTFRLDVTACGMILQELVKPIELEWIKPRTVDFCAFDQAVDAYRRALESGRVCVLTMNG